MHLIRWLLLGLLPMVLISCVETEQTYYINEDGAGKVKIEARMTSGGEMEMMPQRTNKSGKEDEKITRQDKVKMVEKVRKIVNKSQGVTAWDSIRYRLDDEGKIIFSATAYFDDIKKLKINKIPFIAVKEYGKSGIKWALDMNKGKRGTSQSVRTKSDKELTEDEIDERVDNIKTTYQRNSAMMRMAMEMFEYEATFHFPYKIKSTNNIKEGDKRTLEASLDADKVLSAFEKLMDNDEKIRQLAKKGVRKFDYDNPHIVKAAYDGDYYMKAEFKTGLFSGGPQNPLQYEKEVQQIDEKFPEIPMPEKDQ